MIRYCNLYLPIRLVAIALMDTAVVAMLLITGMHWTGTGNDPGTTARVAVAACAAAVLLMCFFMFDLYDLDALHRWHDSLRQSCRAIGAGLVPVVALSLFLNPTNGWPRTLEIDTVLLAAGLCISRGLMQRMQQFIDTSSRVLLVGCDPIIQMIADVMRRCPSVPFRLRGVVTAEEGKAPSDLVFAVCGQTGKLSSLVDSMRANRVAVSAEAAATLQPADLLELRRKGAHVEDALSLYESLTGRVPVSILDPRQIAYGRGFPHGPLAWQARSFLEATIAMLILLSISPMLALLAIAVKLDSPGPVFYRQERVGLGGKSFFVLKFRSMRTDAEKHSGPVWASQRDSRVTRVGGILRLLRFDELPQFWNVVRGDMALIGPRPERPNFVEMLTKHIPFYELRHSIPPGITGWAQVCAGYGATVDESREKLEYDLFYLKNRSVALDALIAVKTIKIMLCGKGAR